MIVLGIDPGIALTGWSIIKKRDQPQLISYGCIKTAKSLTQDKRFLQIYQELEKIIKKYQPQALCIEKLFFNINAKTALAVSEARGVIKICAILNNLSITEFTPLQIKNCITGYGRAEKKQVQMMVMSLLKLKEIPKPDDVADAVATALTYCFYKQELER
ncbi:crossover junction endodeoxyribonuclease RuvC [Candidatus Shapirobacteria bacterium]|nr:crossover junction endodeoxyribonuclease RuvC [Candidatus Shapirobacteria bacterium]